MRRVKTKKDLNNKVTELQNQVDELKDLVNTLLSVICEEPMAYIQVQRLEHLNKEQPNAAVIISITLAVIALQLSLLSLPFRLNQ